MAPIAASDAPTNRLVSKLAAKTDEATESTAVVDKGPSATQNGQADQADQAGKADKADNGDTQAEEEEEEVPKGSVAEAKSLYQKKDSDGKYQWVIEEPKDVEEAAENKETARFAFLVRKKKSYDSRKKYEIDSIIVQSPLLKKCLGIVLKDYPGITTTLDRLVFRAPFHPFVHRWSRLCSLLDSEATKDETTRKHLQLFHDVLYEELKDAIAAKKDLVKNGVITFEHIWTIFEPGTLVFGVADGKERVYQLNGSMVLTDQKRGLDFLRLQVWCVDWDGEKFGQHHDFLSDYEFEGTTPITSLEAFPLEFHPRKEDLIQRLVVRGKIFEQFAGYHYQAYRGVALGYGRCGMVKHNIESRIIIDCDAHNRFLPNYAVFWGALGKSIKVPSSMDTDSEDELDEDDDSDHDSNEDSVDDYLSTPDTDTTANTVKVKHRPLTAQELLLAVPYVRGYAIKAKKWLWFFVDQIEPIKFAENAFASLVLPAEQKTLIRAFVESQVKYKDTFDDVIAGKGRGMIMLLAGPPGVGKTLTSESVAEDMRVPLYMMSAGDLGLDPSDIEESLSLVLDMVSKWNAVLLLDEADVFLEARSTHDLERNKMVSIFLRVLECAFLSPLCSARADLISDYEGVLFLTTNRVSSSLCPHTRTCSFREMPFVVLVLSYLIF